MKCSTRRIGEAQRWIRGTERGPPAGCWRTAVPGAESTREGSRGGAYLRVCTSEDSSPRGMASFGSMTRPAFEEVKREQPETLYCGRTVAWRFRKKSDGRRRWTYTRVLGDHGE